jgi:hypothetical protein
MTGKETNSASLPVGYIQEILDVLVLVGAGGWWADTGIIETPKYVRKREASHLE